MSVVALTVYPATGVGDLASFYPGTSDGGRRDEEGAMDEGARFKWLEEEGE
jgi:hypothetical protein